MLWDGACSFCKYWILYLEQLTGDRLDYAPYQKAYKNFPDISKEQFKKAVVLIEPDGQAYSGAAAATRTMRYLVHSKQFYYQWYLHSKLFRWLADKTYSAVSNNRPLLHKLTVAFLGADPIRQKPYWIIYLLITLILGMIGRAHV